MSQLTKHEPQYQNVICSYLNVPPGFFKMERWEETLLRIVEQLPRPLSITSRWTVTHIRRTGVMTNQNLTEMVELFWTERTSE